MPNQSAGAAWPVTGVRPMQPEMPNFIKNKSYGEKGLQGERLDLRGHKPLLYQLSIIKISS